MNNPYLRPTKAIVRTAAVLVTGYAMVAALLLTPDRLAAQATGRITGTVTGEGGLPLASVQVSVVNTRLGAVTGADGRYVVTGVAPGTHAVRAQRIGYAPSTQQVSVTDGGSATADFQLTAVAASLSEVVVVGYTTQQRRDVSDATAGVTAEEIDDQKVATVEEALRGRLAGVHIVASGEPGRPAQVIIRGQNFVSGSVSPLYVVDGMYLQQNPNLNPDDIESIEVLKDASAAAQYGAQAANGVIVIRTKRGMEGPNRIELRSYAGMQQVPTRVDMMSTEQWAEITRQATDNGGTDPILGAENPPDVNTDWQDAVFQDGVITDHHLSVAGGSNAAAYLVSGGVLQQKGTIIETDFERYSFRLNSELQRGRLTIGENVALSSSTRQGLSGFPLIDVLRLPPAIPVLDPSNLSGYGFGSDDIPTFGVNPVGAQRMHQSEGRSNQVIGSLYAQAQLFTGLNYRFNLGLNYEDFSRETFNRMGILRLRDPLQPAQLWDHQNTLQSLLFENLLTFDHAFAGGAHRLNAVAGVTEQRQTLDTLLAFREGFTNEDLREIDAGQASNLDNAGGRVENALRAFLFRANYAILDRYLLSATLRRDGSSRFGPDNRWANFAAGSVGWVISEEDFYGGIPVLGGRIDYLKLRASTGVLGNQDIGNYAFAAPIDQNLNYLFGDDDVLAGATQLTLANPNIRWQSNRQTNIGLDLSLLDDRLAFTTDYYISESDGLLVNAPIPWSLGAAGSPVVNAGSIRNSGVELSSTYQLRRGDFSLMTSGNLTTTRNKVLSLGNGGQPIFAQGVARTVVGRPIGEFFVLQTDGIFQSEAEVAAHGAQPDAEPGDVRYVDRNDDGTIDAGDRYTAGSGIPDFTYGLFFSGEYRRLDFGLNLRGSHGNEIFNVARWWTDRLDDLSNYRADLRPWTPENPSTTTPRAVFGTAGAANAQFASDRWVEDGSYLRIQNVVIGYALPETFGRFTGVPDATARIYLNVQNLYTFTDFSNWDPETLGFGDPLARGIDDGNIYPNVRTITLGIDLKL